MPKNLVEMINSPTRHFLGATSGLVCSGEWRGGIRGHVADICIEGCARWFVMEDRMRLVGLGTRGDGDSPITD